MGRGNIINNEIIKEKSRNIIRCPKCRSINPPEAKYCYNCGKVFK